jgi:formaldehyde-activating enzyme involved in methanogenesis
MAMNIEQEANKIVFNYTQKKSMEVAREIASLMNNSSKTEDVIDLVIIANSWINFIAGDDDLLYEQNRYHVAIDKNGCTIFRGIEIDTDFRNGVDDETL